MPPPVLVFHSNRNQRTRLRSALWDHFEVSEAHCVEELSQVLVRAKPKLVLAELLLPRHRGIDLLHLIRREAPATEIIAVTPLESPSYAVAAVKAGAFGVLAKNDDTEAVVTMAFEALEQMELEHSKQRSKQAGLPVSDNRTQQRILGLLPSLGRSGKHLIVRGELGTGRKTIVRALHSLAPSPGVLRIIDTAQHRGETLASVLNVAGPCTYTDTYDGAGAADDSRPPIQNTICLLNFETLTKQDLGCLGQLSQEPVLVRLPTSTLVPVRFRVIAVATVPYSPGMEDESPWDHAPEGAFCGRVVDLLPLRHRMEDLPGLCAQISQRCARKVGLLPKVFSDHALEVLSTYSWPGNLLELTNFIERLMFTCTDDVIDTPQLPLDIYIGAWRRGLSYRAAMERMEREFLLRILSKVGGCRRRAAERLQISYSTFKFRLRKLAIGDRASPRGRSQPAEEIPPAGLAKGAAIEALPLDRGRGTN